MLSISIQYNPVQIIASILSAHTSHISTKRTDLFQSTDLSVWRSHPTARKRILQPTLGLSPNSSFFMFDMGSFVLWLWLSRGTHLLKPPNLVSRFILTLQSKGIDRGGRHNWGSGKMTAVGCYRARSFSVERTLVGDNESAALGGYAPSIALVRLWKWNSSGFANVAIQL